MPSLVALSARSEDVQVRGSTAAALVNLALEESCGEALADQGAVAPLITLLGPMCTALATGHCCLG